MYILVRNKDISPLVSDLIWYNKLYSNTVDFNINYYIYTWAI